MKKVYTLVGIISTFLMSLNAAGGGVIVWNKQYNTIDAFFLHFKHSTEEKLNLKNQKLISDSLISEDILAATMWMESSATKQFLALSTNVQRTTTNKGWWAIVAINKGKEIVFDIGYGKTKFAAINQIKNSYPEFHCKVFAVSFFDVSDVGAESRCNWAKYNCENLYN